MHAGFRGPAAAFNSTLAQQLFARVALLRVAPQILSCVRGGAFLLSAGLADELVWAHAQPPPLVVDLLFDSCQEQYGFVANGGEGKRNVGLQVEAGLAWLVGRCSECLASFAQ